MQNKENEAGYLAFSSSNNGGFVRLVFDKKGRDELVELLQSIDVGSERKGVRDHAHLFSIDWGVGDLDKLRAAFLKSYGEKQGHQIDLMMVGPKNIQTTFQLSTVADGEAGSPPKSAGFLNSFVRFFARKDEQR
ncbi:MAG: hypothetical protein AAF826_02545 [Pseudomonadota bacterium]